MSGGRARPRIGRSKVSYKAKNLLSNKNFTGVKFISNHILPWKEDVVYSITKKYQDRGMTITVSDLKIVEDTFFL